MYTIEELNLRLLSELKEIAEELGVKKYKSLPKQDLIYKILDQQAILPENELPKKKTAATEAPAEAPAPPQAERKPRPAPKSPAEADEKPKRARRRVNVKDQNEDTPAQSY